MDPSGLIVILYTIMIFLIMASVPIMIIMSIIGRITKQAKRNIERIRR
jgi:hypothetical protein